jgi:osmotically-inducible protein OsmY
MFNFFHKKDDQIQKDVRCELDFDPSIDSDDIIVSTKNGIVTLSGNVPHFYERYNAESAALRVGGVKSVDDNLEVVQPEDFFRTDSQIADAATSALEWDYQVPAGLTALVNNGWVTLIGQVQWDYQRTAARRAVESLLGVSGVDNEITITPNISNPVDPVAVKAQIQSALKRSASVEGREIGVSVNGHKVTLSGHLDSYPEIETARIAAWNAPGVLNVVNNLTLSQ